MSAKAKQETWRAWCAPHGFGMPGKPDPRLITRDELIEMLERWGVTTARGRPVEETTLRHWASEGLIPTATPEGAPGYERALYPWWMADLVKQLRHYQDGKMKVEQLRVWMRGEAHRLSRIPDWRVSESAQLAAVDPDIPTPLPREFSRAIIPGVARMMARHRTERGLQFTRVELRLVTTSGEALVYTVGVNRLSSDDSPAQGVE